MVPSRSMVTCLCMIVLTVSRAARSHSPKVVTRDGALRGVRMFVGPLPELYVDAFYAIPYAKPPVGDLRFKNPELNTAWNGTRDASWHSHVCPQFRYYSHSITQSIRGDEDCLYLNVYTPKVSDHTGPRPVMVFIHGGGYTIGSGSLYNGTQLASKGVVVVTLNFRLGALGFLSTEDDASIGNYGLRDVIRALEWVRDVISSFNGDPRDVTIFGESSGSATVSLLIQSRKAKGLFSKAIMESGASLCPWAMGYPTVKPSPLDKARRLAAMLNSDVNDSRLLIGCLMNKSAIAIVEAASKMMEYPDFQPVPETTFGKHGIFSTVPDVILSDGLFNNVTILRGFNKDEMSNFFAM